MDEENNMAEAFVAINIDESSNVRIEQARPDENKSTMTLSEPLVAKRRKPGRPRKYPGDGIDMPSPLPSAESSVANKKRGRGRPKGSGQKPVFMDSLLGIGLDTTGGFTTHVLGVLNGEDVIGKIMSVAQSGPRSICILSAQGSVSAAVIRQPCGLFYKYEGQFGIISLTGAFVAKPGSQVKTGKLSVSLCIPDSRIFGGPSVASLVADGDVQAVLGSFKQCMISKDDENGDETEEAMIGPDDLAGDDVVMVPNVGPTKIVYDVVPISFCPPSIPPFFSDNHQDGTADNGDKI